MKKIMFNDKYGLTDAVLQVRKTMTRRMHGKGKYHARNPRAAFAALIDKVSGKGTWEKNPWVFCYSFEIVK